MRNSTSIKWRMQWKLFAFVTAIALCCLPSSAEDVDALRKQAKTAFEHQEYDLAIDCYDKQIKMNPKDGIAFYSKGWAYRWKGQLGAAITNFEQSINYTTNNISLSYSYFSLGEIYSLKREYSAAITNYGKAIALVPAFLDAYENRAIAYYSISDFEHAIVDCDKVLQSNTNRKSAYLTRAITYEEIGEPDKAIADATRALELDAQVGLAFVIRAGAHALKDEYDKALKDYEQAEKILPKNACLFASRSISYFNKGDYALAVADCKMAMSLDTNCDVAYNNLAWILSVAPETNQRDGKLALKYAKQACELVGYNEPNYFGTMAAAYAELGNFSEAIKFQKKSMSGLKLEKDIKAAQMRLGLFEENKPFRMEIVRRQQ